MEIPLQVRYHSLEEGVLIPHLGLTHLLVVVNIIKLVGFFLVLVEVDIITQQVLTQQ